LEAGLDPNLAAAGWNDRLAALVEDHIVKLVRIIGAISDDLTGG
jgi:hypothetical protein